jgi:hypothetical protein
MVISDTLRTIITTTFGAVVSALVVCVWQKRRANRPRA